MNKPHRGFASHASLARSPATMHEPLSPCRRYLDAIGHEQVFQDGNLSLEKGFLPPRILSAPLPVHLAPWEEAARELPSLLWSEQTQRRLEQLPLLSADPSSLPAPHMKRAAVLLGLLASAYWRFGVDRFFAVRNSDIDDTLPRSILLPWQQVCSRLGRRRHYQSTEDLLLNNFCFSSPEMQAQDGDYSVEDVLVENIRNLVPAFDNEAERVFYGAIVEVHAAASPVLREICLQQEQIAQHGPEASEEVIRSIESVTRCVRKATRALMKISAQSSSRTRCDPILWSKTLATFNIPPASYPSGPMSGSASPFVHTLDALIGRDKYTSEYGNFSKKIHDHYLPDKLRGFIGAMHELALRSFVERLRSGERARFVRVSSAFDSLVESFAGEDGFLGKHASKVLNYLSIGTLVGRNQSTSGDQRYVREHTWSSVTSALRIAATERQEVRIEAARPSNQWSDSTSPREVPWSIADVASHREPQDGWIALGGRVFEVTSFLHRHPGGHEIILGNLGRDASQDFDLVPGHASNSVRNRMARMAIGTLAPLAEGPLASRWYRALDHALRVGNSLRMQFNLDLEPPARLVFCGQACCHLAGEHIQRFLELLSLGDHIDQLSSQACERIRRSVKLLLQAQDPALVTARCDQWQRRLAELDAALVEGCASVVRSIEAGEPTANLLASTVSDRLLVAARSWLEDVLDGIE